MPDLPWYRIGADLFKLKNYHNLLLVDYYSGFFEINKLHSLTSAEIIKWCKSQFSRYGIPHEVVSDNGPQFASQEFKKFSNTYKFEHLTSSPRHPQANGMAEKSVQTAKRLLTKAQESGRDPYLAILAYRNTPLDSNLGSPAQRLMGRRTNTTIPMREELLKHKYIDNVQEHLTARRQKQKFYFDRQTKDLPILQPGDVVRMNKDGGKRWKQGVVESVAGTRSYNVNTDGVTYRRNRRDIIATREDPPLADLDDPMDSVSTNDVTENNDIDGNSASHSAEIEPGSAPAPTRTSGRTRAVPMKLQDYVLY